jgi:Signal transduction histidine kinase
MAIVNRKTPELESVARATGPDADNRNSGSEMKEEAEVVPDPDTGRYKSSGLHIFGGKTDTFRVLFLIVVAVVILGGFKVASNGIDRMLLAEKLIEKQLAVELIAEQTDISIKKDKDWDSAYDHYIRSLLVSMELLDRVHMTYAALFDENLQNLSARSPSYEGSPFEPNLAPEFARNVKANESGNLVLPFTPPGAKTRDMYLHYRWLPSDKSLPHRVLAVVAISMYTINTKISMWVQVTAMLLVIATFAIAIFIWRKRTTDLLNRTLEETVRQRTLELEEQTSSAQKASMAKSDFLSNMSHEMRTPMNAIIGMTAIAKNSEELTRKDYCLKKIEDASTHLLSVINDILDMSKIEANKFELSIEAFNFERVLQKVADVVVFRVDEKHQNFTVHIDKNIPIHLVGDDQRVTQVVTNLMSNAVKFTPEGGSIQLNAYLLEEKDAICTVKVEVTDTGIGISPEQQSRLFSSFVQAENSTTRKYGGTGLGLAISKHIIEMMDGRIWIESELGKGSTFAFTFKAERVAEAVDDLLEIGINWANMDVLVVDDDPDVREYFTDIMQRFGSQCDVAASGEEACALIDKNGPYTLYFVDWRMPEMDGIELSRRINSMEDSKSIIIMVSSADWNEIEDGARSVGVDKFLSKPLFPSNIADCINECLGSTNITRGKGEGHYKGLFKGRRIILAEDVEVNREIVLSLLEPTELVVDTAENGQAAFDLFKANPNVYDLIFMDVQMPEVDGYEATQKIRKLDFPKARRIPIVAMSANVFREDIEKCMASGMNDHLGKPLNYEKMISKLCEYLFAGSINAGVK